MECLDAKKSKHASKRGTRARRTTKRRKHQSKKGCACSCLRATNASSCVEHCLSSFVFCRLSTILYVPEATRLEVCGRRPIDRRLVDWTDGPPHVNWERRGERMSFCARLLCHLLLQAHLSSSDFGGVRTVPSRGSPANPSTAQSPARGRCRSQSPK